MFFFFISKFTLWVYQNTFCEILLLWRLCVPWNGDLPLIF